MRIKPSAIAQLLGQRFNDYGHYIGEELPPECVSDCSASGAVDNAVTYWRLTLNFEVPRELSQRYLIEAGIERERVTKMDNDTLAEYVLWLACCDIRENGEWFGVCL